ncbi:MAG: hypothetical protein ACKOQY_02170, partial [Bacteroidota bacterium]
RQKREIILSRKVIYVFRKEIGWYFLKGRSGLLITTQGRNERVCIGMLPKGFKVLYKAKLLKREVRDPSPIFELHSGHSSASCL